MAISQPTMSARVIAATIAGIPVGEGGPFYEVIGEINFTSAGFTSAAAGDLGVGRLPAGNIDHLREESSNVPSRHRDVDLDIGIGAYVNAAVTTVSLNGNQLADSLDVGGGAIDQSLPLPSTGGVVINSRDGATVVASFDTANSPASGTLRISIMYLRLS
jgi:hypothetical protein